MGCCGECGGGNNANQETERSRDTKQESNNLGKATDTITENNPQNFKLANEWKPG